MPSIQSTLGDEEGIAEELAESQRQISIAEFFEKNKHMLGFDSGARALVTAVKEAVDNALDATEEAGIKPDIYVEIDDEGDYYTLVVEDNGPGITKEQVPKVFGKLLYGSRFHAREQSLTPDQKLLVKRDGEIDTVPIGVLCDAYLPQEGAETVPLPDDIEVPSFDRETHEMTWQPITHAIRHETDEQTYEITTEKGRTVEVTGNHSLFSVTPDGETTEIDASSLEAGDTVLTPRTLPSIAEPTSEVNLLKHLTLDQLRDKRVYVYGFDSETLEDLRTGETVRQKPSEDSPRKRYYYRYDGVEILRDSFEQNYIEQGYLPAETVLELGWEEKAADCEFKTYQVGGEVTTMPVTVPISKSVMELLAHYISEGHADDRQVGFTFGSHESNLIDATERAVAGVGGTTTTVDRERNSTRVKAFGSPLAMFLKNTCGDSARTKRVPEFVFEADEEHRRQFIAALYQGDGSDSHPSNELSHTTTSETLACQLSVLWNMEGVLASTETLVDDNGYGDGTSTKYRTKVYGEDADFTDVFDEETTPGEQRYKRIPTSLLEDVRVGNVKQKTVSDTIPGLLLGAGVGSKYEHAEVYRSLIEDALAGNYVEKPRYVHNLKEKGLLDDDHQPTETLEELWETVQNLHGLTDTDMCLLPVKSVEKTEPPEYVYDISVPGSTGYDENFVVVNDGALSVKNSRGQQGIGISAAVLYSQLTSGKPAKITSRTKGSAEAEYFELVIDSENNEPEIKHSETTSWDRTHGTRIELEMEGNMRARTQLLQYVKDTAVVNPHARITFKEPSMDEAKQFERAERADLPAETEEIRPHPHGVELGTVLKMLAATDSHSISGFVQEEFTRVGRKTADSILDNFRDRHFGREASWKPPESHEQSDFARAVANAVANKTADATAEFGDEVAEEVCSRNRVAHHELTEIVSEVSESVGDDHGETFGQTVQENAVEAGWAKLVEDRTSDLYQLVDKATSTRKDDEAIHRVAELLAKRFTNGREHDRATHDELREYADEVAEHVEKHHDATFGETARENVVMEVWNTMMTVPDEVPKVREFIDDRDMASDLLEAMTETDIISPPTNCLSPITDELVEAGLRKEYDADFYAAATRDAEVHGGDPFIVEAGIAYGGELDDDGQADVLRFANRVPLVYQRGACATTDVVKSIGWRNYNLSQPGGSGIPTGPAVIMVHVASTNVPFTSESKDAVANVPEIEDEIELAIREAARELKSYLNKRKSLEKRKKKQNVIATILPKMAEKLGDVTGEGEPEYQDAMARIMNNVLVEREVEDGTVRLSVENNSSTNEESEITEIVTAEPSNLSDGAIPVEMGDEWHIKWTPSVSSGKKAVLEYEVADDASFKKVRVPDIEDAKLTNNTEP